MKIVADEKIPLLQHYFGEQNNLILKNGRDLQKKDVLDADLLIVRSVTKVNADLLQDTSVKWVGCVTTGSDHLDCEWLKRVNIPFYIAAGCNATAVVEYVICVIAALQKLHFLNKPNQRAAVIGCGRIGSQVVSILKKLGFEVLQCDPYRAQQEENFSHTPLQELCDLDLVLLHTPLTKQDIFPTYHMIDSLFLARQKRGCILLSAGRGAVVNFSDLQRDKTSILCLDVWENEPFIDLNILNCALIATPHIAGHSIQSKYRAIEMVYNEALIQGWLKHPIKKIPFPTRSIDFENKKLTWQEIVLNIYDPTHTSYKLKTLMKENNNESKNAFDFLRNQFNKDEFGSVYLKRLVVEELDYYFLKTLGFLIHVSNTKKLKGK